MTHGDETIRTERRRYVGGGKWVKLITVTDVTGKVTKTIMLGVGDNNNFLELDRPTINKLVATLQEYSGECLLA